MHLATYNRKAFLESRQQIEEAEQYISELPDSVKFKLNVALEISVHADSLMSGALQNSLEIGNKLIESLGSSTTVAEAQPPFSQKSKAV